MKDLWDGLTNKWKIVIVVVAIAVVVGVIQEIV